ncbi:NAD(P)H-hydrate dehydratase [Rhodovibrionaceae bacterium A322]
MTALTSTSAQQQALLTVAEMYEADRLAMASGPSGVDLMESAGRSVVREIRARWAPCPVLVLAGPGNNGGDGFVIARVLAEQGWPVRLALLGNRDRLTGDAAVMAGRWSGPNLPLSADLVMDCDLVVDALFGAGLDRPLGAEVAALVAAIEKHKRPVVAVDVPSGLSGDSGQVVGTSVFKAELTVTFFRRKPGHLLLPGRDLCGELVVSDIGIPESVLSDIRPSVHRNDPSLWTLPCKAADGHKYKAGHLLISGGRAMTGAARLAARAASRTGAGLVTILAANQVLPVYQMAQESLLTLPDDDLSDFEAALEDCRRNCLLFGPGAGISPQVKERAELALASDRDLLLDADGLSIFAGEVERLTRPRKGSLVITPHDGELARLFPDLTGDRLTRARQASRELNAVVLLKGADTVVASPEGRAVINDTAPPDLATAGSGDVLSGVIAGLMVQGMPAFEAAAAGCWLHGQAAQLKGSGLIADDLPDLLPEALESSGL